MRYNPRQQRYPPHCTAYRCRRELRQPNKDWTIRPKVDPATPFGSLLRLRDPDRGDSDPDRPRVSWVRSASRNRAYTCESKTGPAGERCWSIPVVFPEAFTRLVDSHLALCAAPSSRTSFSCIQRQKVRLTMNTSAEPLHSSCRASLFLHPHPRLLKTDLTRCRKARTLKHLTVRLVGQYNIGWTDNTPYESGVCLERTVSLLNDGEELQLEKGEHTFEVSPS